MTQIRIRLQNKKNTAKTTMTSSKALLSEKKTLLRAVVQHLNYLDDRYCNLSSDERRLIKSATQMLLSVDLLVFRPGKGD